MAERVTEFPTVARQRKSIYPWDEWTDGSIWQVTEGVDFTSSLKTFVQGAYAHAKRHDLKVEVRTVTGEEGHGVVVFRFVPAGATPVEFVADETQAV